jgi:glycosyltransferase involved in cell wall biosynthesis
VEQPFLSIIIPAYNEEARIVDTLRQVTAYLSSQPYSWEVLVVDDGSTDGTAALVEGFKGGEPRITLVRVPHGGKGWAVKNGMLRARGLHRFICDADLSMPIHQLSRFLQPPLLETPIVIGSREARGARRIGEPPLRHLMGRLFNLVVRLLALPGLRDTQCGFKCFRGEVAQELFALQRLNSLSFDVEILFLARKRGLKIIEVPIDWYYRPRSKVRLLKDPIIMVRDILGVRWNHMRGRYRPTQPVEQPTARS